MKKVILLLIFPLFCIARIQVTTYMPLEQFFLEKIAGQNVIVKNITYIYSSQVKDLSKADINSLARTRAYFHFGLDIEKKYAKTLKEINPKLKVFDLSKGIEKIDNNPYFWTDPLLLRKVIHNIYDALLKLTYFNKDFYKQNRDNLLARIDKLFLKLRDNLYETNIYNIYVFSDYWHYFARRFSINLYKKSKEVVKVDRIEPIKNFVDIKNIKMILIKDEQNLGYALSLNSHTKLPIKKHNIFDKLYFLNMEKLSLKFIK
ncbi:MAG: metal ABC transporter solute-binding protein, Zn/Mn family [Campylobacterota bacterium]